MKRKHESMIPVGIISLLMIFLILCLVTFSLLSLSSATADEKLNTKMAERTREYYAACKEGYKILEILDNTLLEIRRATDMESAYFEKTAHLDTAWQVSINDNQVLAIEVELLYPTDEGDTFYKTTRWQVVNISDWTPDKSQPVYQGK